MTPSPALPADKRFRVALSFPGSQREYVSRVAQILATAFGEEEILYDRYHTAEFARPNLGLYLPKLYREQSDLIVVMADKEYNSRRWCGLEWSAIYSYIMDGEIERIMPFYWEGATLPGLNDLEGFVPAELFDPEQAANLVLERLARNDGKPKSYYAELGSVARKAPPDATLLTPPQGEPDRPRSFSPTSRWQVGVIDEVGSKEYGYEFHLEYPVFQSGNLEAANEAELQFAMETRNSFKMRIVDDRRAVGSMPSYVRGRFSVELFNETFVSIRYSIRTYFNGGAHDFPTTITRNYSQESGTLRTLIQLAEVFSDHELALQKMSEYCINELQARSGPPEDIEWIRRGAGPHPDNFSKWNFTNSGIFVVFDPYDVAHYAAGQHQVWIPHYVLDPFYSARFATLIGRH